MIINKVGDGLIPISWLVIHYYNNNKNIFKNL